MSMTIMKTQEATCNVAGCEKHHYAKGHCKQHYTQVLRHGKLTPDRERGIVRTCKVEDCERTDTIQFHCRKHARQLKVHGRLTPEREHVMGAEGCRISRCTAEHRAKGLCAQHYNQARFQSKQTAKATARPAKAGKGAKRATSGVRGS